MDDEIQEHAYNSQEVFDGIQPAAGGPVSSYTNLIRSLCKPSGITSSLRLDQITFVEASVGKLLTELNKHSADFRELHKSYVEPAIRTCFWMELKAHVLFRMTEWIIRFAIACVEVEILDPAIPYAMFQEACDWGDAKEKEQIADLFLDLKDKWRSPKFSSAICKTTLLRFATELLSRLSKTTSAKIRGKLLCYVSARIPVSDKSAANILGEFNNGPSLTTEGLTTGTANNVHENAKFSQLCNLLDYFRNPNLIIAEKGFPSFKTAFEQVLELIIPTDMCDTEHEEGEHVEDGGRTRILTVGTGSALSNGASPESILSSVRFIPDPSPTAFEPDLKQDRVKRNLLSRFLFVAQYICLPAKAKGAFEPSEEQVVWCEQMVQTALAILSRTNPNGPLYVERIMDHLESEATMSIWKDRQCPPLQSQPKADLSLLPPYPQKNQLPYAKVIRNQQGKGRTVTRRSIKDLPLSGQGKFTGSMEVTRVLNKGPNTQEEFHSLGYQPPPLDFFVPVVEQAFRREKIKDVNNDKFQWRALRILGKRTHIHFSNEEKNPTKDIGSFLENYVLQLVDRNPVLEAAKKAAQVDSRVYDLSPLPQNTASGSDNIGEDGPAERPLLADNMDDIMDANSPEEAEDDEEVEVAGHGPVLSKDHISSIAKQIGADWERFAAILKFDADMIGYWKSTNTDPIRQATQMLQVWTENLSVSGSDSNDALEKFVTALKDNYGLDL